MISKIGEYSTVNWVDDDDIEAYKLNKTDAQVKVLTEAINDIIDSVETDKTLTKESVPADSKAVGDALEKKLGVSDMSASTNKIGAGYNFNSLPTPNNDQFRSNILNFTEENKTSVRPFVGKSYGGGDGTNWNGLAFATDGFTNFIQTHPTNKKFYYGGVSGNDRYCIQLANVDSPALTGTPTAPTASADTNTTHLATCEFVKSQSASMDTSLSSILNQYYKKDPSGLIHQFVELEATAEEIDIQFPISFPEKCLFVGVEILNPQKDSSSNVKFETIEKGLDSVKLLKIGAGTPTISVMAVGI